MLESLFFCALCIANRTCNGLASYTAISKAVWWYHKAYLPTDLCTDILLSLDSKVFATMLS